MRLIDADDVDNHIVGSVNLSGCPTIHAIRIPDNTTNGDIIQMMFPNAEITRIQANCVVICIDKPWIKCEISNHWWNASFKGVSE